MRTPLLAHLLRLVTLPYWRLHRLRTVLTVVGVALGVTAVIAMADVSASVLASFRHTVDAVAGDCPLEVTAPTGTLDEALIERTAAVPGVAAAAGVVEAFVARADHPEQALYILGVDFLGSPVWRTQFPREAIELPDQFRFISHVDSIVLTSALAAREPVAMNAPIDVLTPTGRRTLVMRGTLGPVAAARLFDDAMGLMDLPAAQELLGRAGRVDRIAVALAPEANVEQMRTALAAALGPGVEVAPPEARGAQADSLLFALRTMLAMMSACAVIVGALIVYHTVAVSVQERRRHFALLNAAGVGRRALVAVCLAETLLLALAGVALGIVGGRLLGRLGAGIVAGAVSDIWTRLDAGEHAQATSGLVIGAAAGIVTALLAAGVAIRATFAAPTVETLRPVGLAREEPGEIWLPIAVAVALLAASWLVALTPPGIGYTGVVTAVVAACCAVYAAGAVSAPALVLLCGALTVRLGRRSPSLPGRLAAANLPRNPGRSGATVATIAVAMAIAVNVTGMVESFNRAFVGWIEQHFAPDLLVGAGGRMQLLVGTRMPDSVGAELREVPGVAAVEPFRAAPIRLGDRSVYLQGIALDQRLAHGGLPMVEGTLEGAAPALRAGSGVLLSDNLAYRLGLHRGDTLAVPTPAGPRRFRIEGIYIDYLGSLDLGAVAVAYPELARTWGDHDVNLFRLWTAPGTSPAAVRSAVLERLGVGRGYYVLTAGQFLDAIRAQVRSFFLATWALQVIAAIVGVIGVVNAQLATVLDRSTEIAVLRTIGFGTRDLTRSILLECGALGIIGALSGVAIGAMVSLQIVTVALRLVTGWRIPFTLPIGPLLVGVAAAALVSAIAGWVPARAAARVTAWQQSVD